MAKGSGGGGRSGGRGGGGGEYGKGVNYSKNTIGALNGKLGFVPASDITKVVIVKPTTEGSEKQISWANNIKTNAMRSVDETAARAISKGANKEKALSTRNKLLSKINAETNAKKVIDNIRGKGVVDLAGYYGIK